MSKRIEASAVETVNAVAPAAPAAKAARKPRAAKAAPAADTAKPARKPRAAKAAPAADTAKPARKPRAAKAAKAAPAAPAAKLSAKQAAMAAQPSPAIMQATAAPAAEAAPDADATPFTLESGVIRYVAPQLIQVDPTYNTRIRNAFDPAKDEDDAGLVRSMRADGFDPTSPLLVRIVDGKPMVVRGHRRLAAALLAKIKAVPVLLEKAGTTPGQRLLDLVKSNNNKTPSMLGQGQVYSDARKDGYDDKAIASSCGKTVRHVQACIAMLSAPEAVISMVRKGQIAETTAYQTLQSEKDGALPLLNEALALGKPDKDGVVRISEKHIRQALTARGVPQKADKGKPEVPASKPGSVPASKSDAAKPDAAPAAPAGNGATTAKPTFKLGTWRTDGKTVLKDGKAWLECRSPGQANFLVKHLSASVIAE